MEIQNNFKKYYPRLIIINLLCVSAFIFILQSTQNKGIFYKLDIWINSFIESIQSPPFNIALNIITKLGSPGILSLLAIIITIILILRKKWYYFTLLLLGMVGGQVLKTITKIYISRERPENAIIEVSNYSFPSGHATIAIIFFVLVAYSFRNEIKNLKLRHGFLTSSALLILLIGISRIYLNAHWTSDVLAGFILGIFWITFLVLILKLIIIYIGNKKLDKIKKFLEDHLSYLKS